ncbi:membrane protein [Advenella faeciporci]|uniref:Membrane protein n=1 Tax=Advenella faeciporci TaxID=797535 RepID=A0A918N0X3_9BURK|nr:OmpA family protein [Advenella faeciporci]GGW95314.1 membrane protein [Advenella faeciporci]
MKLFQYKTSIVAVAAALVLSACGTMSNVSKDGTADELVWPNVSSVKFDNDQGTFPVLGALAQVREGVTRDQLYYLIGRPHFAEGFRVKEWDYLFHFNTPGQGVNNVSTCLYKVLFDNNLIARNFYWKPVTEGSVCPDGQQQESYTLSADALFAFDRSDLSHVTEGRAELAKLASHLKSRQNLASVTVVGHTDRLGSDAYNQKLSQDRAVTIANYLVAQGVPANLLQARGAGKSQPVVQCEGSGAQLIQCLAPNRRVEINIQQK